MVETALAGRVAACHGPFVAAVGRGHICYVMCTLMTTVIADLCITFAGMANVITFKVLVTLLAPLRFVLLNSVDLLL